MYLLLYRLPVRLLLSITSGSTANTKDYCSNNKKIMLAYGLYLLLSALVQRELVRIPDPLSKCEDVQTGEDKSLLSFLLRAPSMGVAVSPHSCLWLSHILAASHEQFEPLTREHCCCSDCPCSPWLDVNAAFLQRPHHPQFITGLKSHLFS